MSSVQESVELENVFGKLSGLTAISLEDELWERISSLTSERLPSTRAEEESLEWALSNLLKQFVNNNVTTGNLAMTVRVFVKYTDKLLSSPLSDSIRRAEQVSCFILVIRTVCKYFSERMPAEALQRHMSVVPVVSNPEQFGDFAPGLDEGLDQIALSSLLKIITTVPISNGTIPVHCESISLLIVILGTKMFDDRPADDNLFFKYLMSPSTTIGCNELMKRLVENFSNQPLSDSEEDVSMSLRSMSVGVASRMWDAISYPFSESTSLPFTCPKHLANKSILLAQILSNHCSISSSTASQTNPYRNAMTSFTDFSLNIATYHDDNIGLVSSFSINFDMLYLRICDNIKDDQSTLLLYMLLHKNSAFRNYVLCRTDIETLVLPLLQVLYNPKDTSSHQLYMVLIILLILSEDNIFNKVISETTIAQAAWFDEKLLTDVSISSLLVLTLLRTIQFNITQMKDKYLHTNCLATLANMSIHFCNLHQYCSQRFVSLTLLLQKKQNHLLRKISQNGGNTNSSSLEELETELAIVDEILRLILEIINSALSNQLVNNASLIHALMYEKQLFNPLRGNHNFQDVVHNIDTVLNFFLTKLEREHGKVNNCDNVLKCINDNSKSFPMGQLQKFPPMKFRYCEEEEPEDFFIPYVWSMAYRYSGLYWNLELISLFKFTS